MGAFSLTLLHDIAPQNAQNKHAVYSNDGRTVELNTGDDYINDVSASDNFGNIQPTLSFSPAYKAVYAISPPALF